MPNFKIVLRLVFPLLMLGCGLLKKNNTPAGGDWTLPPPQNELPKLSPEDYLKRTVLYKHPRLSVTSDGKVHAVANYFEGKDQEELLWLELDAVKKESQLLMKQIWKRVMPEKIFQHHGQTWALVSGLPLAEAPNKLACKPLCRHIYLVNLKEQRTVQISSIKEGITYFQNPSLAIKNDQACLSYEGMTGPHTALYWRCFNFKSQQLSAQKIIVSRPGSLVRRPSLVALPLGASKLKADFALAYDLFTPKRLPHLSDPVYHLELLLLRLSGEIALTVPLVQGEGMNYAPSLAVSKTEPTELLLAFHSNTRHALLKFPELLAINLNSGKLRRANLNFLELRTSPQEESQGDEYPRLKLSPSGVPVILTRPSHGSHIHVLTQSDYQFLDLDSKGWGARDLSGDFVFLSDHEILIARRDPKTINFDRRQVRLPLDGPNLDWQEFAGVMPAPPPLHHPLSQTRRPGVYFGDIHTHSWHSDGTGSPDEIYARLYQRGLDFAVLTDHDNIIGSRLFPSQFEENIMITEWFNRLPGFATLQGQEWTTPVMPRGFGHKNIYYAHEHPHNPVLSFKGEHPTTTTLFETLRGLQAFAVPHHTGWTGMDWENHDEKVQPLFEVASVHGVYEALDDNPFKTRGDMAGMFARDGLSNHHHFGFVGASDAHGLLGHHGNGRHLDPWGHGLSGVELKTLNRHNLWYALAEKKVWATTGTKIVLLCRLQERESKKAESRLEVHWELPETNELTELALVINGKVYQRLSAAEINQPPKTLALNLPPQWSNAYVRILTTGQKENGEAAFCSPLSKSSER